MEEFLLEYGYWILGSFLLAKSLPVAGGFFSGNTALYLSGLFAGLGDFRISYVILIGLTVVLVGDNIMFVVGKYYNDKFPKLQLAQNRIQPWLDRTQNGDNMVTYFYMHAGMLRAYLPFFLGYSKMANIKWFEKVSIASVLFVPVVAMLGFTVGKLDVSNSTKAVITGMLWIFSAVIATKITFELYETAKAKKTS